MNVPALKLSPVEPERTRSHPVPCCVLYASRSAQRDANFGKLKTFQEFPCSLGLFTAPFPGAAEEAPQHPPYEASVLIFPGRNRRLFPLLPSFLWTDRSTKLLSANSGSQRLRDRQMELRGRPCHHPVLYPPPLHSSTQFVLRENA